MRHNTPHLERRSRRPPNPIRQRDLLRWLLATAMILVLAVMLTATKLVSDISITGPLHIADRATAAPTHATNVPATPPVK